MDKKKELPAMEMNEDMLKIKKWQSKYWKKFNLSEYNALEISEHIHQDDLMLPATRNMDGYKITGMAAAECIEIASKMTNLNLKGKEILVLPSGYGREYRYLVKKFKDSHFTACDIENAAVDYCVKEFGGQGIYSKHNMNDLIIDKKFDVIWVGSLFSHLSLEKWGEFLTFFKNVLNDEGLLIFTSEGHIVSKMVDYGENGGVSDEKIKTLMSDYHQKGFGHVTYSSAIYYSHSDEELGNYYGRTIVKPEFVFPLLKKHPEMRVVNYMPDFWCARQDVYTLQKDSLYQAV